MNEGLLIFKFENGKVSSPWLEGFKCWIEEIKDRHKDEMDRPILDYFGNKIC